jgi:hypothetical protein
MMGHAISFFASGNKVSMKWISDAAAMQQFVATVREHTDAATAAVTPGTNVAPPGANSPGTPAGESDKAAIIEAIKQLGRASPGRPAFRCRVQ